MNPIIEAMAKAICSSDWPGLDMALWGAQDVIVEGIRDSYYKRALAAWPAAVRALPELTIIDICRESVDAAVPLGGYRRTFTGKFRAALIDAAKEPNNDD